MGRNLQHWAFNTLGETAVAWIIGSILAVMAAAALVFLWRRMGSKGLIRIAILMVFLAGALAAIIAFLPRTEERLHFVTFGLFGYLSAVLFPLAGQAVAVLALSGGDELLQHYLPDRTGSGRDVAMNVVSGVLGVVVAHYVGSARRKLGLGRLFGRTDPESK